MVVLGQPPFAVIDRMTSIRDENGNLISFEYDANGNMTLVRDAFGQETKYSYDLMDRLVAVEDKSGAATRYTYDELGRLSDVTGPGEKTVHVEYNPLGRPVGITGPDGQTWSRTYDLEGIPVSITSPRNKTIEYETSNLGQLTGIMDPLDNRTSYEYDNMARLISATDPEGIRTDYTYHDTGLPATVSLDGLGQASFAWSPTGNMTRLTDPRGNVWSFGYSALGRLVHQQTPSGLRTTFDYDLMGRLNSIVYPEGERIVLDFDPAGNLTAIGPEVSQQTSTYDSLNRLVSTDNIAFGYNAEGMITRAGNGAIAFVTEYDAAGRIKTISREGHDFQVQYTYNDQHRLATVSDTLSGAEVSFSYDLDGSLTNIQRSNGVDTAITWDAASRLTGLEHDRLADLQYDLDQAGRVRNVRHDLPLDPGQYLSALDGIELDFGQDAEINTLGYAYDDRGRLIRSPQGNFSWDWADRLVQTGDVAMTYNGAGDWTQREVAGRQTQYAYSHTLDMNPLIVEYGDDLERYYVWAPQGLLLYMVDAAQGNSERFFHFDREGNTIMLTDANGSMSDAYAYDPYGNILAHTGDTEQPFTFCGQYGVRREPMVEGLYYMRSRFYDAFTARFLVRDMEWPNILFIKELNPYQYVGQDPVSLSDPLGTGPLKSIGKALAKDIKNLAGLLKPTKTQIAGNVYNGAPQGFLPGGQAMVSKESVPDIVGEAIVALAIGAYLDAVGMPAQWTGDGLEKVFENLGAKQNHGDMGFKEDYFVDLQARLDKMSNSEREAAIKFLKKNARVLFDLFQQWQEWQRLGPIPVGGPGFDPTRSRRQDVTVFRTGAPAIIPLALYGASREVQKTTEIIADTAKEIAAEPFRQVQDASKSFFTQSNSRDSSREREIPLFFKKEY